MKFSVCETRKQLFLAAICAALFTGGCLGSSSQPKPHVIRSKVAQTPPPKPAPAPAPAPATPAPATTAAATAPPPTPADNTKVAKKTPAKSAKKAKDDTEDTTASAEPDKILYDRSMLDIKKGRYTEARLSLQALINTYPDSEYLAKAKLAVADSFYKEGGTSNFTQAVEEYKNFIIFFPFLDEAAYAQLQVGMAHYRMMEKSDRDNTNAEAAEDDYQTFLLKYPNSPLAPQAEQRLRDVQEVLADGEFKIARFYYIKQDFPASAARLVEVVDRYPLYSGSDDAVWMLSDVYERARQVSKNEDIKNHFTDLAAKCYDRIITDYPLSKHAADAKSRLKALNMPIPVADAAAVARMQKQQAYEKEHHEIAAVKMPKMIFHSGPDLSTAARSGAPNLAPPTDAIAASDVLKPSAAGPTFSMGAQPTSADQNAAGTTDAIGGDAEEAAPGVAADPNAPTEGVGAKIIAAPASDAAAASSTTSAAAASGGASTSSNATTDANTQDSNAIPTLAPEAAPAAGSGTGNAAAPAANQPATSQPATPPAPASTPPANGATPATPNGGSAQPANASPQPAQPAGQGQQPAASGESSSNASQNATKTDAKSDPKSDDKSESSSKKKKGLKKLIPW